MLGLFLNFKYLKLYLIMKNLLLKSLAILFVLFSMGCSDDDDDPIINDSSCNNMSITIGKYKETDDLNAKIKNDLGNSYSIADWNDLKNISDLDSWVNCMNLNHDDGFMLTRDGNYFHSGSRQYYVHYSTDGVPYSSFAVHDKVGNFYLGSWYGLTMNVLAKK